MKTIKREMKGVILAGGKGTRLYPLTLVTNKHLLPVYNKPVIYYAIEKMVDAGINKIMIVTSPHHMEDFVKLLGSGENFKVQNKRGNQIQIVYGIQNEPLGTAQGLWIAKDYIGDDNCMLYLGDNIIEDDLKKNVNNFNTGAEIFLKKVKNPKNFGIAEIDKKGNVLNIEEKPKNPKSDLAVIGVYLYDNTVFEKFEGIKLSKRGEYEMSHINNKYIKEGKIKTNILTKEWFDTGSFESLIEAGNYMKNKNSKK
ncbi:MAG: sugar phosphate nucleotidyltransferase [Candidatus Nomurabacteria bacterium]|nr:sugar phosphate nucleotidyltransferase [Candidatus Nomurabacteria bacterium]